MSTVTHPSTPSKSTEPSVPLNDEERKLVERIAGQRNEGAQQASRFARRLLTAPLLFY